MNFFNQLLKIDSFERTFLPDSHNSLDRFKKMTSFYYFYLLEVEYFYNVPSYYTLFENKTARTLENSKYIILIYQYI